MRVPVIKEGRRVWVEQEDAVQARADERARKKELSRKEYQGPVRPDRSK